MEMGIGEMEDFELLTREEMAAIEEGIRELAKQEAPAILARAGRREKLDLIDRILLRMARERVVARTRKGGKG